MKYSWMNSFLLNRLLLIFLVNLVSFQIHILFRPNLEGNNLEKENQGDEASYTVCNGMSNQILGHIASLTSAVYTKSSLKIPDAFIVDGTQCIDNGRMKNKVPTTENSVSLSKIFALDNIRKFITKNDKSIDLRITPVNEATSCDGWLDRVKSSDPNIFSELLSSIMPSPLLQKYIRLGLDSLGSSSLENGICFHHRDGQDWHNHCQQWENIKDGIWRGNCREQEGRSIHNLLKNRLTKSGNGVQDMVLYYVGDHEPPISDLSDIGFSKIVTHEDILGEVGERAFLEEILDDSAHEKLSREEYKARYRDLWAVLDYFTCSQMKHFVGNSVSTWSALQIAKRNGYSSWYNSQSIPLAGIIPIFPIPIVYTYTELSQLVGKVLLKISILSVREHLGNRQPIHILYHGHMDTKFIDWLRAQDVILHKHYPQWKDIIERHRLKGNKDSSHLFAHAGNYLGTWQRIDIPDFIASEYCLYLDADTLVVNKFSMADFGLNITKTIAFSLESESDNIPHNAGIALMNVPKLRETKPKFLLFIEHGLNETFSAPSDQGAYKDFYHPAFLDRSFNIKPYFHNMEQRKVVHFHGPKPHEWFKVLIGEAISPIFNTYLRYVFPINGENHIKALCFSLLEFVKSAKRELGLLKQYCVASFPKDSWKTEVCIAFFEQIDTLKSCDDEINMFAKFNRDMFIIKQTNKINVDNSK